MSKSMPRVFLVLCSLLLVFPLAACNSETKQLPTYQTSNTSIPTEPSVSFAPKDDTNNEETYTGGQIQITTQEGNKIVFQLNHSTAAESLYSQLPLSVSVENYGDNEKIFYPPDKLDISDTPLAEGPVGTLAYYEPWGDIAIYYGECGGASGLYELGDTIDGAEYISEISGEIYIDVVDVSAPKQEPPTVQTPPPTQNVPITQPPTSSASETQPKEDENVKNIQVAVKNKTFTATLAENTPTQAFVELMKAGTIVINMNDHGGFEKVGALGSDLPTSNNNTTTQSGDIVLYNGNQIVIFYGTNTWSYTRLGKIDDLFGWEEALGDGDVTVTFSIK